jgi:hypothetical protein
MQFAHTVARLGRGSKLLQQHLAIKADCGQATVAPDEIGGLASQGWMKRPSQSRSKQSAAGSVFWG